MKTLRWGILSTAKIAQEWLIPALQQSPNNEVVAVASRDKQRGQDYAQACQIPKVFDDYETLLASQEVDAIYNPMPNHLHVPYTIKALQAGKHVLCEKPLGLNAGEVKHLLDISQQYPQQLAMEAFMYRFHPQWKKAIELITNGELGELRSVEASFTFFNRDPSNVRNQTNMGGGSLMDVGCYCISAARTLFGRTPQRVSAQVHIDPEFGVDSHTSGVMDFGPGTATFYCSTQSAPSQRVHVIGEKATMTIENPFYSRGVPSRLLLRKENDDQVIEIADTNHYIEQVNAFASAVLSGLPSPSPLTDALDNMKTIDAIFKAGDTGQWESV